MPPELQRAQRLQKMHTRSSVDQIHVALPRSAHAQRMVKAEVAQKAHPTHHDLRSRGSLRVQLQNVQVFSSTTGTLRDGKAVFTETTLQRVGSTTLQRLQIYHHPRKALPAKIAMRVMSMQTSLNRRATQRIPTPRIYSRSARARTLNWRQTTRRCSYIVGCRR